MILISISNNIIAIISFIVNLFFLIPFIYKVITYFTRIRYIEKILAYNNEPIQIYQSIFQFTVADGNRYSNIECSSLEEINNVLKVFDFKIQKYVFTNHEDSARNEMCIGGFYYNKRTYSYFIKYFNNFKIYVNEKYEKEFKNDKIDTQFIVYSNNKFGFEINEDFLYTEENKKDFAFLIKLTPNDFGNDNKKFVHILFGGTYIGTIKATEYLKSYSKEIYKKYKNGHYFFAVEINLIDNSFNHRAGIIDLTDRMFTQ